MKTGITILALGLLGIAVAGIATGSDFYRYGGAGEHEYEDHDEHGDGAGLRGLYRSAGQDVAPADNHLYREECGACHFAYQPGLLPAASWERIMAGLADHFGDDAQLPAEQATVIARYLAAHAAGGAGHSRSQSFAAGAGNGATPLRITETRYFLRKHDEIPARMVTSNPDVGSFSRCDACHRGADRGSYDEHQIDIPNYGRWDD